MLNLNFGTEIGCVFDDPRWGQDRRRQIQYEAANGSSLAEQMIDLSARLLDSLSTQRYWMREGWAREKGEGDARETHR